ncbi:MAG: ParB/RepB/Spo0J family partition protein [Ruminococcus sp.]|nr:ParB/RepB/Spo0J family partition protein [Ruminococcus sp.]
MAKNNRMKNGLDSLFADNYSEPEKNNAPETGRDGTLMSVRISMVEPDRDQPRKVFDEEKLSELADNIISVGVLSPLIVKPGETEGRYTIVAGERRWRAARLAGLTEVPVIVREFTPQESAQISLIENLQREDLNPVEEAKAFARLKTAFGMKQEEIARAVGKSRPAVANSMRLLDLEPECLNALEDGKITAGHAKALLSVTNRESQLEMLEKTLSENLTVRELEAMATAGSTKKPAAKKPVKLPDKSLEEYRLSMRDAFGVDAAFRRGAGGKMSMKVSFSDEAEMQSFLKRLMDK